MPTSYIISEPNHRCSQACRLQHRRQGGFGAESHHQSTGPDGNTRTSTTVIDRPNRRVTTTASTSLSTLDAVSISVNGQLISQTSHSVAEPVLYAHDAMGRVTAVTDPRTQQDSITVYNAIGQVVTTTDPLNLDTDYVYYPDTHANAGMLMRTEHADNALPRQRHRCIGLRWRRPHSAWPERSEGNTHTSYAYDHLGRLTHQWGDATYPLAYAYDSHGDMAELRTYRAAGDWDDTALPAAFNTATASVTSWTRHAPSGMLLAKTDDANESVSYTYLDSGLLETRTWARGVETTYTHDGAGRLTGVSYDDGTPGVAHSYRRDGRRTQTIDAAGTRSFTWAADTAQPAGEAVTGGLLDGLELAWTYDQQARPDGFSAEIDATTLTSVSYGYDNHSRLNAVSDAGNTHSAEYGYHPDSDILHTTTLKQGATTRLTTTRAHDDGNCPLPLVDDLRDGFACNEPLIAAKQCLTSITSTLPNLSVASSHSYTHNALPRQRHRCIGLRRRRPHSAWPERSAGNNRHRRIRADLADGSYWAYTYNDKGEVIGAEKRDDQDTPYPGLSYGYTFDEPSRLAGGEMDSPTGLPVGREGREAARASNRQPPHQHRRRRRGWQLSSPVGRRPAGWLRMQRTADRG